MKTISCLQSVVAGVCLLSAAGCTVHEHGYVSAGATVDTYYDYDYYPGVNVYYYPRTRVYYWSDGGRWSSGHRLPSHYVIRDAHREPFRSHSRQPWTERR